jgi:hypothetical protein
MPVLLFIALLSLGASFARLQLGVANDAGSPDPRAPYLVDDPTLAQAIYGQLGPERPAEHYRFVVAAGTSVRARLLIPERSYEAGLRAQFAIGGPGLPGAGATSVMRPVQLSVAGRHFTLAQVYLPPLPESGAYTLTVRRLDGAGVYCLCLGDREGPRSDKAMRARIARMLRG